MIEICLRHCIISSCIEVYIEQYGLMEVADLVGEKLMKGKAKPAWENSILGFIEAVHQ